MPTVENKIPNRLIYEKSPYLLQHAYNPVDWYPWGEEAFAKAKAEDKPIFLSIGYSTCHWCHVMERESFEDAAVAEILNRDFISVKVDREERPDLDHIYMEVCQALTGSGGWPLSAVLDTEGRPFFAGTYFPKPQFMNLLMRLGEMWCEDSERLLDSAGGIVRYLETAEVNDAVIRSDIQTAHRLDAAVHSCFDELAGNFDTKFGGFGNAPKFPSPHNLLFLMLYAKHTVNPEAMDMTHKTLEGFYRGGINDHIGGGYARYSTDRSFLAPHFEKMLYDNAMLTLTFSESFKLTGDIFYRTAAEEIVHYVLRDMTSPEGGFYSAEDADSEGEEGRFYLLSPDEVEAVLGKHDGRRFCDAYDITPAGNFEGRSIPNLIYGDLSLMQNNEFKKMRHLLFEYREKRVHPFKDDKILLGWNGLMIAAFAKAAKVFNRRDWLHAAERAFTFAESNMTDGEGTFLSRWRDGEAKYPANGEDLAFLIWGLLELHAAAKKREYLDKAVRITEGMLADFSDETGGFFLTGKHHEKLISRPKPLYDGAIPSLNSVMAYNLIRIYLNTGEARYKEIARRSFGAFAGRLERVPSGQSFLLYAHLYDKTTERVCTEDYCAF